MQEIRERPGKGDAGDTLREGRHRPDPAGPTPGTGLTRPSLFPGTLARSREQGPQSRVGQPSPPPFLGSRLCYHIWGLVVTQTCSLPEILNSISRLQTTNV